MIWLLHSKRRMWEEGKDETEQAEMENRGGRGVQRGWKKAIEKKERKLRKRGGSSLHLPNLPNRGFVLGQSGSGSGSGFDKN
jgi:hypothetical protein